MKVFTYLVLRGEFRHTDRSGRTRTYRKGQCFNSSIDLLFHRPALYLRSYDITAEKGVPHQSGIETIRATGIDIELRVTLRPVESFNERHL